MTAAAGSSGAPSPVPPPANRPPANRREEIFLVAKTMAIGAIGGALFHWLGTPLPWMLGALF
ncbi:MAG: hypothetical protein MI861_26945, partial [Pirellulales bacterium]|nr:hypothetical protein [Pirellulales bacterium]